MIKKRIGFVKERRRERGRHIEESSVYKNICVNCYYMRIQHLSEEASEESCAP